MEILRNLRKLNFILYSSLKLNKFSKYQLLKHYATVRLEKEYTDTAQYPEIDNIAPNKKFKLQQREWHTKIQKLPTVEQKLIEMNMPKYYGFRCHLLADCRRYENGNNFIKFVTRTHVLDGLPKEYYSDLQVDHIVEKLKPKIEELIYLHHHATISRIDEEHKRQVPGFIRFNNNFILDLNTILLKAVQSEAPHLSSCEVDIKPRIEGFWIAGGFELKKHYQNLIKRVDDLKHALPECNDLNIRSTCKPAIAVRVEHGLPEVVSMDDVLSTSSEIPFVKDGPKQPGEYGIPSKYKRACIIPGYWPGVEQERSQIVLYPRIELFRGRLKNRNQQDLDKLFLQNKSIICGFTQANSHSFYQGFTPMTELTYPFTKQTVSTDGKNFHFSLYQMNTCVLHSDRTMKNPRNNLMWQSEDMPLFDCLEGETVKGLNEEVLKLLVSMYLKRGTPRENPTPYLADYKFLMHHEAPREYKALFQRKLNVIMRELLYIHNKPTMHPWERIYKVLFKTRPRDVPRKYFENQHATNPFRRRLDEYILEYIPRYNRIDPQIKKYPRINSEHLFVHDHRTLVRSGDLFPDNAIAFKTLNVLPNSDRYRSGKSTRKWRRTKNILHTIDPSML